MSKIQDVVSWVMPDDKILKLEKKNETYDISDKVFEYLKGQNLLETLEDKAVEVEIDESQGQSGVITHLSLSDSKSDPKNERPPETEPQDCPPDTQGLVVKEITVGGVSVEKSGVVDKDTKTWYTLDSTISAQAFKDECTKKVVEITIAPQEKGNDIIKGYILKVEDKKDEPVKETKKYTNSTGNSIEAQASVKSANVITSQMVDKDTKPEFVEKLITRIARHNFKTIQELKNKE